MVVTYKTNVAMELLTLNCSLCDNI